MRQEKKYIFVFTVLLFFSVKAKSLINFKQILLKIFLMFINFVHH